MIWPNFGNFKHPRIKKKSLLRLEMRQDPNQSQQLHFTCNDPMHHDLARNLLGNTVLHFTIVTTCTGKGSTFGGSIRRACVYSLRRWIPLPRPIYGPKGPTMIYPNLPVMISVCGPVGLPHDTFCRPESYGICIIPWQFVVFFRRCLSLRGKKRRLRRANWALYPWYSLILYPVFWGSFKAACPFSLLVVLYYYVTVYASIPWIPHWPLMLHYFQMFNFESFVSQAFWKNVSKILQKRTGYGFDYIMVSNMLWFHAEIPEMMLYSIFSCLGS